MALPEQNPDPKYTKVCLSDASAYLEQRPDLLRQRQGNLRGLGERLSRLRRAGESGGGGRKLQGIPRRGCARGADFDASGRGTRRRFTLKLYKNDQHIYLHAKISKYIHVSCKETKNFICKMRSACSVVVSMHYKVCKCSQFLRRSLVKLSALVCRPPVLLSGMKLKSKQSAPESKKSNKTNLDRSVARFFYENAYHLNVVSSSSF